MGIKLSDHFTFGRLLKFVAPSIIMLVFTSIYTVIDGLFISNFVGATAVSAINRIFPLIIILGSIGFMLGTGGSALVSKTMGEGDYKLANAYFSMLVYVTAGIGVAIALAGQFAVPPIARLLGAKGEELKYCVMYGRVLLGAQPFFILQNVFQSFFVTAEKPRLGLLVIVAAGITNMVLDALFVAGFGWGLDGAAAATAASQFIGGAVPVIYFACPNKSLLRLSGTRLYFKALLKSAANGSSEFLSNVSASVVTMLYNFSLDKYAPVNGVPAYGVIMYVVMVFFSVFMGYSVGCAPLIGYNYGAQNREELKNLFKKSMIFMAVCGAAMTALSEALAVPAVKIFSFGGELYKMTLRGFRIYSLVFLLTGYSVFASSLFTALNNGPVSACISFLRTLLFQIGAVLLFPLIWGLDGVWSAGIFAEIASVAVSAVFIICLRKRYGYA